MDLISALIFSNEFSSRSAARLNAELTAVEIRALRNDLARQRGEVINARGECVKREPDWYIVETPPAPAPSLVIIPNLTERFYICVAVLWAVAAIAGVCYLLSQHP